MDTIGQAKGPGTTVPQKVAVTLTGTFEVGRVSVDGQTIPLDQGGSGSETVMLIPPDVDVRLMLTSPSAAKFDFSIRINGREKKKSGSLGGGKVPIPFRFSFKDFAL